MKKVSNLELSISKNYVCTWGLWEAIREILQNAQDSSKDGNKIKISYDNGTLDISNLGEFKLPISSLVLGNSVKSDGSIGKYGEGYKLALLVLLRLGLNVKIYNQEELWTPYFEMSKKYGTEVLKISIEPYDSFGELRFSISGINSLDTEMLKKNSLVLSEQLGKHIGRTVDTDYGKILLDSSQEGRFYVEGLFIQKDDTFKYGYSFNSDSVSLDRDRRAINYYDLLDLTADALLSLKSDFSIVETSITSKTKDTLKIDDFYKEASKEFSVGYAKHFLEKHELDEDTFIGTEKEILVSGSTKAFKTDMVQASIVNKGLNKEEEYAKIKSLALDKTNKDTMYLEYSKSPLKLLNEWVVKNSKMVGKKRTSELLEISSEFSYSSFSSIKEEILTNVKERIEEIKWKQ